ncbi:hypothetical protein [Nostoc sp.]|uniref:hypothetical protein n=1 Tax=Nostoc sp. TaxID=1180 RepID=UPI002FFB16C3
MPIGECSTLRERLLNYLVSSDRTTTNVSFVSCGIYTDLTGINAIIISIVAVGVTQRAVARYHSWRHKDLERSPIFFRIQRV